MSDYPHISLEQWRTLIAVVEAGGYAQAAEVLHKSQSSVTYAVQKIGALLNLQIFEMQGRRAVLTEPGQVLYRRARTLVEEALFLERGAAAMSKDWKPEIAVAADIVFPTWLLLACLKRFGEERPQTRVEIYEPVLSTDELLVDGTVDLAISGVVPNGFLGDPLMRLRFVAVASPDHPLHQLGRALTYRDLRRYRQIVIRDSGSQRARSGGWLGAEQRWTVSHKATSIRALVLGAGFAWIPEENIRAELESGALKPLPLREGGERFADLYMIFGERDYVDPDTSRLAEIIRESVTSECARSVATESAQSEKRRS